MSVIIVILILTVLLFALPYFTKRRFGVLGLALAAGATLSKLWAAEVTPYVRQVGVEVVTPPLESIVAATLIMAPAALLLLSGPTYHALVQRIVGSAAFAVLALAFLLEPLGGAIIFDSSSQPIYSFLLANKQWIITGGILFALFDLFALKLPGRKKHSEH